MERAIKGKVKPSTWVYDDGKDNSKELTAVLK
jgi:hypothetical protein